MGYGNFLKKEREIKRKLQSECDIPKNVQQQVDDTLEKITGAPILKTESPAARKQTTFYVAQRFRFAAACLTFALLAVGGTVGAYSIWNHFEETRYGITEQNKNTLKKENILDEKNLKVTQNGVTVECVETVASGPYAHVLLKVTVPETVSLSQDIGFDEINALENTKFDVQCNAGLSMNRETFEEMVDHKNGVFYYEFTLRTCEQQMEGEKNPNTNWDGQILNLQLKNIAQFHHADVEKFLVKGTWKLDIPMKASDEIRTCQTEAALSCGATVKKIELSPISIKIIYDMPRKEIKIPVEEDGKETIDYSTEYESPNVPTHYELKDGTKKEIELSMGSEGYLDDNSNQFIMDFAVEKILDLKNITAIYFGKEKVELK